MNVADLVGLLALLVKVVDTARYATAKQINGVVTQVIAWGLGVGGVFAVAQTQWAAHISVGNGTTLAHQGAFSLVAIGLSISSSGSVLKDLQAALDSTNTAVVPPLLKSALGRASGVVSEAEAVPMGDGIAMKADHFFTTLRSLIADEIAKIAPTITGHVRTIATTAAKAAVVATSGVSTAASAAEEVDPLARTASPDLTVPAPTEGKAGTMGLEPDEVLTMPPAPQA
jgi:hypothetical protein